ncbi:MAG: hypothetical protein AAF415_15100 [Pseudomonadota bacterium]
MRNVAVARFGFDYRLASTPLTANADYRLLNAFGSGSSTTIHSVTAGLSLHFGTTTLRESSREGPIFEPGFSTLDSALAASVGVLDTDQAIGDIAGGISP